MTPILSFVIPVYNMQDTILRAVCSALGQVNIDLEVVVVDDGSTDHTAAVVEALADPRVNVVRKPNGGVASALNTGVEAAKGKYVYTFGADDWLEPNSVQYPVMVMETRPEVGFVYGSVQYHNEGTWRYDPPPYIDGYFFRHYPAISGYIYRRDGWLRGCRYRDNTIADWDHALQLITLGYCGETVPILMYNYWLKQSVGYLSDLKANKQKTLNEFKVLWPQVTAVDF